MLYAYEYIQPPETLPPFYNRIRYCSNFDKVIEQSLTVYWLIEYD